MFDVGDRVACVKYFPRRRDHAYPNVGCVYTVEDIDEHVWHGYLGIRLVELPADAPSGNRWYFRATHFRKVTDFEEPKRKVEKVPTKELVDA